MSDVVEEKGLDGVERPLVTFALFAYNQEKYIREAVEGALAQSYSPLEIILSDDCSTDGTYEIMQEMVSSYMGPHKVILNRNSKNLQIAEHINKVVRMARGAFIIVAAGDDVSFSRRTESLVNMWLKENKPMAIGSDFIKIDALSIKEEKSHFKNNYPRWINKIKSMKNQEHKRLLMEFCKWNLPLFFGATMACRKDIFEKYGYLQQNIWYEDRVLYFRSILEKSITFNPEVLVQYRKHTEAFTNRPSSNSDSYLEIKKEEIDNATKLLRRVNHLKQHIRDLEKAFNEGLIDLDTHDNIYRALSRQIEVESIKGEWWKKGLLNRIFFIFRKVSDPELRNWAMKRLFPLCVYCWLLFFRKLLVSKIK